MFTWAIEYVVGNTYKVKKVKADTAKQALKKGRVKSVTDLWPVGFESFKLDEFKEVAEYMDYTLAFVRFDEGRYLIEVPEDTYYFDSKEDLMENIRYNLNELRKEQ